MNERLVRQIVISNPQWRGESLAEHVEEIILRESIEELTSFADDRQIVLVTGPRRSGKTTAITKTMQDLLDRGVNPKNTMYFSFDEVLSREHTVLEDVVSYFLENVVPTKPSKKNPVFLFLDEIQFIHEWPTILKRIYETKPNVKIFASGSSSLGLRKGMGESLAGRAFDITIPTLSFREYLAFKGIEVPRIPPIGSDTPVPESFMLIQNEVTNALANYLVRGGYPETVDMQPITKVHRYIRQSVLDRVVYHDLPETESIASPASMMHLLKILASMSSQMFEIANIAPDIGMKAQTASKYLSILERAMLFSTCYNYTKSMVKQARSSKRSYLTDTGLISALLGLDDSTGTQELGRLAETAAYNHLSRTSQIFFWRDPQGNEVDIVLPSRHGPVPIELKYQTSIYKSDAKGLARFCDVHGCSRAYLVTKDRDGTMELGDVAITL
ncbi:MAG: ATP-binding protein, partial [Candidatus Thermoplasmatota archaeon]|nr:ATP-binding protein [Candidatus Thermoplasmatota archaeon]